jgi:hypothetical protein
VKVLRRSAAIACWFLLVALAVAMSAGLRLDMPLLPQETIELDPGQLAAADGRAVDGVLRVRGADANGVTVVAQPVVDLEAERFRYLTLELGEVPVVLRAVALWRLDGSFQAAPLPGSFRAAATLDLRDAPAWQGRPDAIGFALLPTDYLAPVATRDREFSFVAGRLESESWAGALRALSTQWRAYRPWNGRSNHTGGFELSATPGPALQLFVFCVLFATLLAAAIAGGPPALRRAVLPAVVIALSVLAARQGAQIGMRAQVAVAAQAAIAELPEWPLAAMPAIGHDAVRLVDLLATQAPPRVLVWGESGFFREYPTWLLRALNAASLNEPGQMQAAGAQIAGTVIVLAGPGSWQVDGDRLAMGGMQLMVEPLMAGTALQAYRIAGRLDHE